MFAELAMTVCNIAAVLGFSALVHTINILLRREFFYALFIAKLVRARGSKKKICHRFSYLTKWFWRNLRVVR
jgi:hypothetical protein